MVWPTGSKCTWTMSPRGDAQTITASCAQGPGRRPGSNPGSSRTAAGWPGRPEFVLEFVLEFVPDLLPEFVLPAAGRCVLTVVVIRCVCSNPDRLR